MVQTGPTCLKSQDVRLRCENNTSLSHDTTNNTNTVNESEGPFLKIGRE